MAGRGLELAAIATPKAASMAGAAAATLRPCVFTLVQSMVVIVLSVGGAHEP
jgi:hypothetical protein